MAKQILFVQGGGADVHDGWDAKLVESLRRELGEGYVVRYPRMPDEADPHYAPWRDVLLAELESLDDAAILVGHSLGGAFLLHVLAEGGPKRWLGGLCLVAVPFIGEGGWPPDEIAPITNFGEWLPPGTPVFLYHGAADQIVPAAHLKLYAKALPQAVVRRLAGRDHQLDNDLREVARDIRAVTGVGAAGR